MNEYYLKIEADLEKVVKLREEITKLEIELKKIDVNQQPKMVESIQKQMASISAEMQKTIDEINKMASTVVSQVQRVANAIDINNLSIEDSMQILRAYANEQTRYLDEIKKSAKELEKASSGASSGDLSGIEANLEAIRAKLEEKKITIKEVKAELAGFETTYTTLTQRAADYSSQIQTLEATRDSLIQSGQMGSPQYTQVIDELNEVQLRYQAVQAEQEVLTAYGRGQIAGLASGISGLANVLVVAQGAMSLFGASSQQLAAIQGRLQTALAITNAIQQVYCTLSTRSAFSTQILIPLTRGLATAQTWLATTLNISAVAARALMTALTFGIATAITAVVTLIDRYITKQREEKAAQEEAIAAAKRRAEEERNVQQSMASSVASQVVDYKRLQIAYNELGDDMDKKKKFIQDNQGEFDKLGVSVNSILDAENLFVGNEQAFIQSLTNRALAAAAMKMAEEDYTKAIQKMMEVETYVASDEDKKDAKAMADQWLVNDVAKKDKRVVSPGTFEIITTDKGKKNQESWVKIYRGAHNAKEKEALELTTELSRQAKEAEAEQHKQEAERKLKVATGFMIKSDQSLTDAGLSASSSRKQNNKYDKAAVERMAAERIRANEELAYEVEKARIATLEDGEEKVLATMALNNKREIEAIKQKKAEALKAEKEAFEKDRNNRGKTYDSSTTEAKYDELIGRTIHRQITDDAKNISDRNNEALAKYQTYYDKLTAIQKKYEEDRKALKTAGGTEEHFAQLDNKEQEEVDAINKEFAMRESTFVTWANGIANAGIDELRKMLVEAERELERQKFLNPKDKKVAVAESKVKTLKDAVDSAETKTDTDPKKKSIERWNKLKTSLTGVSKEFGSLGKEIGGTVGEIMSSAGEIAGSTFTMIDGITKLVNWSIAGTESAAQGASKSIQAVEKASVILAIIGAAFQIMNKLKGFFAADTEDYEKAKEAYEDYLEVLDRVIEKQKELIASMTGENAKQSYEYALQLIKTGEDAARQLGRDYLNSGASSGFMGIGSSASKGVKQRGGISNEAWNQAKSALGSDFNKYGINDGRMTGLFDLPLEQLQKLEERAPLFWAQLHDDTKKYLADILSAGEKSQQVKDAFHESMTSITFDELKDSLDDLVKDADLSFNEIQKSFEEHMSNAILNFVKKKILDDKLKKWYEKFADAMSSGDKLTKDEADQLQKEYERIAHEANKSYLDAMTAAGLTVESEETQQESTKRGFETMSQDTGEELNGRFTALQMAGEEIKTQNILQTEILAHAGSQLEALLVAESEHINIADETREIIVSSYLELQSIRENTGAIVKPINNMSEKLDNIERKIQTL